MKIGFYDAGVMRSHRPGVRSPAAYLPSATNAI